MTFHSHPPPVAFVSITAWRHHPFIQLQLLKSILIKLWNLCYSSTGDDRSGVKIAGWCFDGNQPTTTKKIICHRRVFLRSSNIGLCLYEILKRGLNIAGGDSIRHTQTQGMTLSRFQYIFQSYWKGTRPGDWNSIGFGCAFASQSHLSHSTRSRRDGRTSVVHGRGERYVCVSVCKRDRKR